MSDREVIEQIKEQLVPYLVSQGVKVSGTLFRCFTGTHKDDTPSCGIVPASHNKIWHCFSGSCEVGSGDIFTAAHYLEGLRLEGPDFWKQTVPELAKRFHIEYEAEELSQEDKERFQLLAIHKDAANIVISSLDNKDAFIQKYIVERGWNVETARTFGLGSISSFNSYIEILKHHGWSNEFIKLSGLADMRIFDPGNIIFIIRDLHHRPVGFAGRKVSWKSKEDGPKYVNSKTSCIYSKSNLLFNLDNCLDLPGPLWVVEGYPDCITLWQAGIKKVCAVGGTSLTSPSEIYGENNHLDTLKKHNLTNVILCLDADEGGVKKTQTLLKDTFEKVPEISLRICDLPEGTDDPDTFIREKSLEEFQSFPLLTPFVWRLEHLEYNDEPKEIAKQMIQLIVAEPNAVERWEMCKALSGKTNIPLNFISDEVNFQCSGAANTANQKIVSATRELQKKLYNQNDPDKIMAVVNEIRDKMVSAVEEKVTKTKINYADRLSSVREVILNSSTNGLSMGKFTQIQRAFGGGFPTVAKLMSLTGPANIGKSAFVRDLSWEIARSNDDVHVIVMTIDDSFMTFIMGYISLYTSLDMDFILNRERISENPIHKEAVWKAFDMIGKMKDRIEIRDASDGDTLVALERHISNAITKYPEKKIVVFLDNFHRLKEVDDEDASSIQVAAKQLKRISQKFNVPMFVNVEAKKTEWNGKMNIRDMRGSVGFEYITDLSVVLHQSYHYNKQTNLVWQLSNGSKEPIDELDFQKNKISGFKGSIYMKFQTRRSRFEEAGDREMGILLEKERKTYEEKKGQKYEPSRKTGTDTNSFQN